MGSWQGMGVPRLRLNGAVAWQCPGEEGAGWGSAHSCSPLLQGIVGNLSSGKSALVHRYLTGTYVQEESPEGKANPSCSPGHLVG